jgi:hypothetical protein
LAGELYICLAFIYDDHGDGIQPESGEEIRKMRLSCPTKKSKNENKKHVPKN